MASESILGSLSPEAYEPANPELQQQSPGPAKENDPRWNVLKLIDKDDDGWTPLAKAFKDDPHRIKHIPAILAAAEGPVLETVKALALNGMLVEICAARDPHGKPGLAYALEAGNVESIQAYGEALKKLDLDLDQEDREKLAKILESAVNRNLGFIRIARSAYREAKQNHPDAVQAYKQVIRDLRKA